VLDNSGVPTELWTALRARNRAAFGAGIRRAYTALFAMYPDAHRQDDEALMAFARSHTDYAEGTQRLAVRTFKTFVTFADFDSPTEDEAGDEETAGGAGAKGRDRKKEPPPPRPSGVGLTVNIQLQLPPSTDGEIYDKLFEAMAKHLKGLITLE
jgi:hypothetical protein